MLVSSSVNGLRILTGLIVLGEEILALVDEVLDFELGLSSNLVVLVCSQRLEKLDCQNELVFSQVRSIEDGCFLHLKVFWLGGCQSLILLHEVTRRNDDVILDILDQSIDEWASNVLDSALDPVIVVKEISFTSQDTEVHRKVIIFAVDNGQQAISYFLSNI